MCPVSHRSARLLAAILGAVLVAATLLPACGSGEATTGSAVSASVRTKQEPLAQTAWDAETAADPALAGVASAIGQPFQAAGVIEDLAGDRLVWAEFAANTLDSREAVAAAFRVCTNKNVCVRGKASYTATGIALVDSFGTPIDHVAAGAPVLLKYLKAHSIDKDPTILAPLNRDAVVSPVLAKFQTGLGSYQQRRFVIFNAYGPQVGVDVAPLRQAVEKTGLYDTVLVIDFVRRRDIDLVLPSLTPLDAVVWLGAGVQEKFTDKAFRPVGLTVSRGVFGDELYHSKMLADLLGAPPLGGPGLIVLAGSNTLTADYLADKATLAYSLYLSPYRPVLGFAGKLTAPQAIAAAAAVIGNLAAGKTLGAAMAASTAGAAGKWLTPLDKDATAKWLLPAKAASFWQKPPSAASLVIYVKVDPKCWNAVDTCDPAGVDAARIKPGNQVAATELEAGAAKFECDATFVGPYFECSAKNAATSTDFWLKGVMRGHEVGSYFFFYLEGSAGALYKDMAVVGEGLIDSSDVGGGTTTLKFKGKAASAPYIDKDGHCCIAKTPLLQSYQSEPGSFKLSN